MKSLPQRLSAYFWNNDEEYYKKGVGYCAPYISFVKMQIIRLVMFILVFLVWCTNFYINVKKCVIYINFWSLTATLFSLGFLFVASGRQVIERQLTERNELEDDQKSGTWRFAVAWYSIAWPFTVASTVLFSVFLWEDQICSTYYDFGFEQWRGYTIVIATYISILALMLDFAFNRINVSYRHLIINILMYTIYIFMAFIGSIA